MKKGLKYITLATALTLSATGCNGNNGNDGADGQNGQSGTNGSNGRDGRNGLDNAIDGIDHAQRNIIGATAIDADGSAEDDTVLVDFAGDVTRAAADLEGSKLTFSYAKQKGSKLSVITNTSMPVFEGLPVAHLNETTPDGVGSVYSYFGLMLTSAAQYDNDINVTMAKQLARAINESIGIPNAVFAAGISYGVGLTAVSDTIEGYKNSFSSFQFGINRDIPLVNFNDEGKDIGIVVTIPAFTITDHAGNGNEEYKFRLMVNEAIAAQEEPRVEAFKPDVHIIDYNTNNENCILEKSGFTLQFATPMEGHATELAIKRSLEAHDLLNFPGRAPITVTVTGDGSGKNFTVKPSENINLWALEGDNAPTVKDNYAKFVTCALDLSIPQYHATTQYGIDNASGPLNFHITDITYPELAYHNEYIDDFHNVVTFNNGGQFPYQYNINDQRDTDTVMINLNFDSSTTAKVRALDGNNPYLEANDSLIIGFTEPVKESYDKNSGDILPALIKEKLLDLERIEKWDGAKWVKASQKSDLEPFGIGCGAAEISECTITIPPNYRLRTDQDYIISPVTLDNDKVIDIEAGTGNVAIKQKEGRPLVARSANWLVPPAVLSYKELLSLPEGSLQLFTKDAFANQFVYDLPENESDMENATAFVGLLQDYNSDKNFININSYGLVSLINFELFPELENATISGNSTYQDSIVVFFNKYMNFSITKAHLAYVIGHGKLQNAKRYTANPNDPKNPATPVDGFDIDVSNIHVSYDSANRVTRFVIKLMPNQYIKADGNGDIIFDMDPVAGNSSDEGKISIDKVRLPINPDTNKLVIPVTIFDPAVKPVLESVVGKHTKNSRHCGNSQAEEKDTITFIFNHLLRHDRKDAVSGDEQTSDTFIKRQIFKQVQKLLIDGSRDEVGQNNLNVWSQALENINYGHSNAADFMTITSNQMDGDASMEWFRSRVVYTVTIADDPVNNYDPQKPLNWSTNRPRYHFDVSQPREFTFDPDTVITSFGQKAENQAAVTAKMAPFDDLSMNLSVINNVVQNDGKFVAHDSFQVSFNCPMDDFYTLKAIQKGFDELAGDGIFRVNSIKNYAKDSREQSIYDSNKDGYQVEVLPGREFITAGGKVLQVENVATWTGDGNFDREDSTLIAGPFKAGVNDALIPDKIFRFVPGSNQGFQAQYKADTAANAGIWYLNSVSNGLGRIDKEIPIVFSK